MKTNDVLMNILTIIAVVVGIGLIMSLPVMWLWNVALVPALPMIKPVGWLQAWGIMILAGFLFKNPTTYTKKS